VHRARRGRVSGFQVPQCRVLCREIWPTRHRLSICLQCFRSDLSGMSGFYKRREARRNQEPEIGAFSAELPGLRETRATPFAPVRPVSRRLASGWPVAPPDLPGRPSATVRRGSLSTVARIWFLTGAGLSRNRTAGSDPARRRFANPDESQPSAAVRRNPTTCCCRTHAFAGFVAHRYDWRARVGFSDAKCRVLCREIWPAPTPVVHLSSML
jgi:hypothetical protein